MGFAFNLPGLDVRTLSERGVDMAVTHNGAPALAPDGTPVVLTVLGPDSAIYRGRTRDLYRRRFERTMTGQPPMSYEEEEEAQADVLAACVVGWRGVLDGDGEPIPCSPEAAKALLMSFPRIRDQIDTFIANAAHFTLAS